MVDRGTVILYILLLIVIVVAITNVNTKVNEKDKIIRRLVRGISRYGNATIQDKSPLIGVLHANYSAGYLYALMDIATKKEIMNATGIDIKKLAEVIISNQDKAHKNAILQCPEYETYLDPYLTKLLEKYS